MQLRQYRLDTTKGSCMSFHKIGTLEVVGMRQRAYPACVGFKIPCSHAVAATAGEHMQATFVGCSATNGRACIMYMLKYLLMYLVCTQPRAFNFF